MERFRDVVVEMQSLVSIKIRKFFLWFLAKQKILERSEYENFCNYSKKIFLILFVSFDSFNKSKGFQKKKLCIFYAAIKHFTDSARWQYLLRRRLLLLLLLHDFLAVLRLAHVAQYSVHHQDHYERIPQ